MTTKLTRPGGHTLFKRKAALMETTLIAAPHAFALAAQGTDGGADVATMIVALYIFALAAFVGYQVISRVPPLLHTPLMSATNAISGISLVGSIVIAGSVGKDAYQIFGYPLSTLLGFVAVTCATINVVGGFMITDRMLRMFKRKEPRAPAGQRKEEA